MPKHVPDREILVSQVFTPATPVSESALFAGRMEQLRRVIDTVNQRGRHSIIFGERGVGKTSLATVIASRLTAQQQILAPRVNCDSGDTFPSLWKKALSRVNFLRRTEAVGFQMNIFERQMQAAEMLDSDATPDAVQQVLSGLAELGAVIVIFDEFDRIQDATARRLMADTIKALSDHDIDATLVIVGVADSVHELIQQHESIERAVVQTKMPPMSIPELQLILDNGMGRLQMEMDPAVRTEIALLCQGFPHYAHSLGLHATRACLDRHALKITSADLDVAIQQALDEVNQTIRSIYDKAVFSPQRDTLHASVLLACALVTPGEFGYFTAANVRAPLSEIIGRPYDIPGYSTHLKGFCTEHRGQILQVTGRARALKYRFRSPLMRPLIIMKGIAEGRLDRQILHRIHSNRG